MKPGTFTVLNLTFIKLRKLGMDCFNIVRWKWRLRKASRLSHCNLAACQHRRRPISQAQELQILLLFALMLHPHEPWLWAEVKLIPLGTQNEISCSLDSSCENVARYSWMGTWILTAESSAWAFLPRGGFCEVFILFIQETHFSGDLLTVLSEDT